MKHNTLSKKLFTYALLLSIVAIVIMPTTVYGADNIVRLEIEALADTRIQAQKKVIFVDFLNTDTSVIYSATLRPENGYMTSIYVPAGNYVMDMCTVPGDWDDDYPVEWVSFEAKGYTTNVVFKVGNPDYKGPDAETTAGLPGAIDRDKTNDLLAEDGWETIDWESLDKEMTYLPGDVEIVPQGGTASVETTDVIPESTNETLSPDETQNPDETTGEIIGDITTDPDDTQDSTDEQDKPNYWSAIIFVLIITLICGFGLWYRIKNAPVLSDEDFEDEE